MLISELQAHVPHVSSLLQLSFQNLKLDPEHIHDITTTLSIVTHEWMNIGILLGISMEVLKKIYSEFGHCTDVCLHKMLSSIFSHGYSLTWCVAIAAVKKFNIEAATQLVSLCQSLYPALESCSSDVLLHGATFWSDHHHLPNLCEAFRALIPFSSKWHHIGNKLKTPQDFLEAIKQDYSHCCDRLREMLYVVLTRINVNLTWFSLAQAVESFDAHLSSQLKRRGVLSKFSVCLHEVYSLD